VAFRHLSPSRSHFVTHHLVDLAVVVLPVLRPWPWCKTNQAEWLYPGGVTWPNPGGVTWPKD
jgi:hypothetical protein